jgi:hypothetical protein
MKFLFPIAVSLLVLTKAVVGIAVYDQTDQVGQKEQQSQQKLNDYRSRQNPTDDIFKISATDHHISELLSANNDQPNFENVVDPPLNVPPPVVPVTYHSSAATIQPTLLPTAITIQLINSSSFNNFLSPSSQPQALLYKNCKTNPSTIPTFFPTNNSSESIIGNVITANAPSIKPTKFIDDPILNKPTRLPTAQSTPTYYYKKSRKSPTAIPTIILPTVLPSKNEFNNPINDPTYAPTTIPTLTPTITPTKRFKKQPTAIPTSILPTVLPSQNEFNNPINEPTYAPTHLKTALPTPTYCEEDSTVSTPTINPTATPTVIVSSSINSLNANGSNIVDPLSGNDDDTDCLD